jgi:hypothetical protein
LVAPSAAAAVAVAPKNRRRSIGSMANAPAK